MKKFLNVPSTGNMPYEQFVCSVAQLASKYPAFTENALRSLIYASKPRKRSVSKTGLTDLPGNGLAHAIIKLGRRVLINEQAFLQWVNSHAVDLKSNAIPISVEAIRCQELPKMQASNTTSTTSPFSLESA